MTVVRVIHTTNLTTLLLVWTPYLGSTTKTTRLARRPWLFPCAFRCRGVKGQQFSSFPCHWNHRTKSTRSHHRHTPSCLRICGPCPKSSNASPRKGRCRFGRRWSRFARRYSLPARGRWTSNGGPWSCKTSCKSLGTTRRRQRRGSDRPRTNSRGKGTSSKGRRSRSRG